MRTGTIALLTVMVVSLFVGGTALYGASPVVVPLAHYGASSHVAPAATVHPGLGNVSIAVTFTSTFTTYTQLPYDLKFSAVVGNGSVVAGKTFVNVEVRDVTTICEGGLGTFTPCPTVVNISLNSTVATGVTSWNTTLTTLALEAGQFRVSCPAGGAPCPYDNGILPNDQFQIFAWVEVDNGVSNSTVNAEQTAYLITTNPSGTLVAPSTLGDISTGNVTVGIQYQGSYISGASVTIYQGTATTGQVVYTQSVFAPGVGAQTVVSATVWYVASAGSYLAVINLTAPYGSSSFSTPLNVVAAGQTVYHNSSSWSNSTLIPGVSSAVAGTILLVVGLIIGMIVALMLGMMMWGGTSRAAPAQPWTQSKTANECSVCHQSFATEAELKEHAKTAHGMT